MTAEELHRAVAINIALFQTRGDSTMKVIDPQVAAKMLSGEYGPTVGGDHASPTLYQGRNGEEMLAAAGMDWATSWATTEDGKAFLDQFKRDGAFYIDTQMTPEIEGQSSVPLGNDVHAVALEWARTLRSENERRREAGEPELWIPDMLREGQTTAAENDASRRYNREQEVGLGRYDEFPHIEGRNRKDVDDTKTGGGYAGQNRMGGLAVPGQERTMTRANLPVGARLKIRDADGNDIEVGQVVERIGPDGKPQPVMVMTYDRDSSSADVEKDLDAATKGADERQAQKLVDQGMSQEEARLVARRMRLERVAMVLRANEQDRAPDAAPELTVEP
jgi:hypothetical protein